MNRFDFEPTVEESVQIAKGKPDASKLRYMIFDGTPEPEGLEALNYDISKKVAL